MATNSKMPLLQDIKKWPILHGDPYKKYFSRGAGSSSSPSRSDDATGEPAVEISPLGRDKLVVRNLPKETSRALLSGVSREQAVPAHPHKVWYIWSQKSAGTNLNRDL